MALLEEEADGAGHVGLGGAQGRVPIEEGGEREATGERGLGKFENNLIALCWCLGFYLIFSTKPFTFHLPETFFSTGQREGRQADFKGNRGHPHLRTRV